MIDLKNGIFIFEALSLSIHSKTTFDDVKQIQSTITNPNSPVVFNTNIDGIPARITLFFKQNTIENIKIRFELERGTTDYEIALKQAHDRWLEKQKIDQNNFGWGQIHSYNGREAPWCAGESRISIHYGACPIWTARKQHLKFWTYLGLFYSLIIILCIFVIYYAASTIKHHH